MNIYLCNPKILSVTLCALLLVCSSCKKNDSPNPDNSTPTTSTPVQTIPLPGFSGQNAYNHVSTQVGFGPRNPGSKGAKQALKFFEDELKKYADTLKIQSFPHTGYGGEKFTLSNVIASFKPNDPNRILLLAHWDTRPRADEDPDATKRSQPIIGANDAASGVGVLLELARVMKEHPPEIGVDILLVDGEDYGDPSKDDLASYFLGSRYFATNLPPGYKPKFGILLDMVGDPNAQFFKEPNSMQYAPQLVENVWKAAAELNLSYFIQFPGPAISDDHGPLNDAGIPTIDIIDGKMVGNNTNDARRQYWHTTSDTMDKISAETLGAVGKLMTHVVYKLAPSMVKSPA